MNVHYCKNCLKLYDEYDSFRKLVKCLICKKYYCIKCIIRTKQYTMTIYIAVCNDCYDEIKSNDNI